MENEKKLNVTEEKTKKKFKDLYIFIDIIEVLFIVLIFGMLIFTVITVIQQGTTINTFMKDIINVEWIRDLVGNEEHWLRDIGREFIAIFKLVGFIFDIVILQNLKKIFKEISETTRPFSETIIKRLEIISTCVWAIYIIGSPLLGVGLIAAITVSAMVYVFKYGYKLQIESDETL